MSQTGTLPRTPVQERKSSGLNRKVKSLSVLLRKDGPGGKVSKVRWIACDPFG